MQPVTYNKMVFDLSKYFEMGDILFIDLSKYSIHILQALHNCFDILKRNEKYGIKILDFNEIVTLHNNNKNGALNFNISVDMLLKNIPHLLKENLLYIDTDNNLNFTNFNI